jgi:hypothetical protein
LHTIVTKLGRKAIYRLFCSAIHIQCELSDGEAIVFNQTITDAKTKQS